MGGLVFMRDGTDRLGINIVVECRLTSLDNTTGSFRSPEGTC